MIIYRAYILRKEVTFMKKYLLTLIMTLVLALGCMGSVFAEIGRAHV